MTVEYLADMSYAELVIKETLRLAAIISTLPKRALTTFEMGGYTIPKVATYLHASSEGYYICPSCSEQCTTCVRLHACKLRVVLQVF